MNKHQLLHSLVASLMVAAAGSALAATATWTPGTTDFNLNTNWTGGTGVGGLPGTGDNATFTGAAGTQPQLTGSIQVQGLTFSTAASSGYTLSRTAGSLTLTNIGTTTSSAINAANTSGTNTISAPIILGGAGIATFTQAAGGTLNISGDISSTNATGLTLANPGTAIVTLSGNNSYSGNTISGAGILNINSATAISSGRLTVGSAGTIDNSSAGAIILTNNNNITISGNVTFTGTRDLSFGSGVLTNGGAATVKTITTNNTGTLTIGGLDSANTGGGFTKSGTGTLAITGAATANVSGAMSITAGTLILGNKSALGTGTMAWGGGTIAASTALTGANAIANAMTITSNSTAVGGSNSIEFTGGVSITATPRTFTNNMTAGSMTISGGALGLSTTNSNNTLTLSGPGTTIISSAIQNNGPGGTATSGNLSYTGTGSLTISNSNNTYSGTTAQSAGTLNLSGTLSATTSVAITGASTIFNETSTGSIGGTGTTFSIASGTATLGGANTYTGNTTLTSGTLNVNHASALGSGAGALLLNGGTLDNTSGSAVISASNNAVTWANTFTTFGTVASTANNSLDLGTGPVSINSSRTLNFAGNGTTLTMGAVSLSNTTGRAITVNGAGNTLVMRGLAIVDALSPSATSDILAGTANISIAGVISNGNSFDNGIIVTSTGTTTFSGNNTYTGTTVIGATGAADAGTLKLSGAGKISNAATTVFGGVFDLNGNTQTVTTLTLGGGASGSTASVLLGAGALNLGGNITYTATNNPNGASITGSGAGAVNLLGDRTFLVNDSTAATADLTVSAVVADGDGTPRNFTKTGAGTLVLSGNNTYTGTTTVTAGTLIIDGNQSAATGNLSVVNLMTLGGSGTIGGAVSIINGGILAPGTIGDATSTLSFNNTNLSMAGNNSKLNLDITGTSAGDFDQVAGIAAFTMNGDITFTLSGTYGSASWDVMDFSSKSGNFDTITLAGSYAGTFTRSGETWTGVGGLSDWTFEQTTGLLSVVPEPSTWALLAFSLTSGMVLLRRRRD